MNRKFLGAMSLVITLPFSGIIDATAASYATHAPVVEMQQGKTVTVKGKVVDKNGEAIIGANVLVKGTSTGTVTDLDGNFTLNASPNANLVISYVGMKSQTIALSGRTQLNVTLEDEATSLDAVVVTALGIKRSEKALSYNVQKVDNSALTKVKEANFVNSLSGKVAGVNITRSSAGIGGATSVVMRGSKSITGNNNVLYVVDGMPIGNANRAGDGSEYGRPGGGEGISDFNSDDIESISVLTGPSAAALYGASAANGVIIINTKKGAAGALKVNFSSNTEFLRAGVMPEFQNTYGTEATPIVVGVTNSRHPLHLIHAISSKEVTIRSTRSISLGVQTRARRSSL